jgi:hypothetical protein
MVDNPELAMKALRGNLLALDRAMKLCLEQKLIVPTLILFYSSLDALGSLDRADSENPRSGFIRWADSYLLKARPLPCSSLELYAARCGILHSFSSDADLTRAGKTRPLVYAWGTAQAERLQKTVDIVREIRGTSPFVAVHVTDLLDAFQDGVVLFLEEARAEPERLERVLARAAKWFGTLGTDRVDQLLDVAARADDA